MASTSAAGLPSQYQVATESGLAGALVSELIPRASTADASEQYSADAKVYDEVGLWRAKVAKIMLDNEIRLNFVRLAVCQPLTCEQLRATVEQFSPGPPSGAPRRRQAIRALLLNRFAR